MTTQLESLGVPLGVSRGRARTTLADVWHLAWRILRNMARIKVFVFFSLVQPVLWLLLYTALFARFAEFGVLPAGVSYLQFFAPGLVVTTVLFGGVWSGMGTIRDIDSGMLEKMLVTPVSRVAIIFGRLLAAAIQVSLQCGIIFLLALILGMRIRGGPAAVLVAFAVVALLAFVFAGFSNGLAVVFGREEPLMAISNFLTLPLMFVSTALVPEDVAAPWVRTLAHFNPVNWGIVAVRTSFIEGVRLDVIAPRLGGLALLAAAIVTWCTLLFRRGLRR